MNISGVYIIKNTHNGKCYIGSSVNVKNRWRKHQWCLRNNKHHSQHFQNAWNTYGEDSFIIEILEECPVSDLLKREQHYMDGISPEYNVSKVAGNRLGCKHSEETKLKIGEKHRGKVQSDETRRKISEAGKGKTMAETTRTALLVANTGKKCSDETKIKIGMANKGKPNAKKGVSLSDATKEAIRKANTGKQHSDVAKSKMSAAKKGSTPHNKVSVSEDIVQKILTGRAEGLRLVDVASDVELSVDVVRRVLRDKKEKNG